MSHVIVVMGVSGCGKTTVGRALAQSLDCDFYDGDDFHPPENIAKMANGIPLDDTDRRPWLLRLRDLIHEHLAQNKDAVIACSALKRSYRDLLGEGNAGTRFVFLQGDFDLIWSRIQARDDHYMKAGMLQSQFDALEEPSEDEALMLSVERDIDDLVAAILAGSL
jgi:gluconokinase